VAPTVFTNGNMIFADRIERKGALLVRDGRIAAVDAKTGVPADATIIDLGGKFLVPGFVDLHVHGGDGSDFMDLTPEAFRTVCRCHARHGTTSLTPTSTVSTLADSFRFLDLCNDLFETDTGGARILGGHLYGPYFAKPAKGCHPALDFQHRQCRCQRRGADSDAREERGDVDRIVTQRSEHCGGLAVAGLGWVDCRHGAVARDSTFAARGIDRVPSGH